MSILSNELLFACPQFACKYAVVGWSFKKEQTGSVLSQSDQVQIESNSSCFRAGLNSIEIAKEKQRAKAFLTESIWPDQRFWIHWNWSKKKAKRRPFETKLLSKWKAVLNSIEVVEENKWKPFARNRMKHHLQRQPLLLWIRSEALMDLQKTYT
jgi:hypothetical protein